nr:2-dehydropantoate 2-reductase [Vibrio aquimaris]
MKIVILGPGAIGSLWACCLSRAGHSVSLWSQHQCDSIYLQQEHLPAIQFTSNNKDKLASADLLLVTLKAPNVMPAIKEIALNIAQQTIVVLMHNGMGTAEAINTLLPNNPLVIATTTHGAFRPKPSQVLHTGKGYTELGGYNDGGKRCDFLQPVFEHALPKTSWHCDIFTPIWHKLAINCIINPLTAIDQVKNGELSSAKYQEVITLLIDEINQVLKAEDIDVTHENLTTKVHQVIEATSDNYSSMHQDIFHKRPSEIDFITGYLLQRAKAHNISAPVNQTLFQKIKQIEQDHD